MRRYRWRQVTTSIRKALASLVCMLAVQLMATSEIAAGEIYKWVDEKGRVRFSDQAPEADVPGHAGKGDTGKAQLAKNKQTKVEKIVLRRDINTIKGHDVSVSDYLQAVQDKRAQAEKQEAEREKPVVMYSTTWCGVCKSARQYFVANNIPFSEYDVENSERGRRDYANLNGRGIPIIFVGKQRMDGFSSARFKQMYPH